MKTQAIIAIAIVLLIACRNENPKKLSVKHINDSVINLTSNFEDTSRFAQAIALLNGAIALDSNLYESYRNKLYFEIALGHFENASKTTTKLIRFRPDSADLYLQRGIFQEMIGDSITSNPDFRKAVQLYKQSLDTMNKRNPYWLANWKNSAICLILAGQGEIIHDFLKENCTTALDSSFYDVEVLSKTRQELLKTVRSKYIR